MHSGLELEIISILPLHSFHYLGETLLFLILVDLPASKRTPWTKGRSQRILTVLFMSEIMKDDRLSHLDL